MTHITTEGPNGLYLVTITLTKDGQNILDTLAKFISREFNITEEDLKSESRYAPLPRARGAFTSILRSKFDFPLKMIGTYLGGRDHSTILMAEQRAKEYCVKSDKYRLQYDMVEKAFIKLVYANGLEAKGINKL